MRGYSNINTPSNHTIVNKITALSTNNTISSFYIISKTNNCKHRNKVLIIKYYECKGNNLGREYIASSQYNTYKI